MSGVRGGDGWGSSGLRPVRDPRRASAAERPDYGRRGAHRASGGDRGHRNSELIDVIAPIIDVIALIDVIGAIGVIGAFTDGIDEPVATISSGQETACRSRT